MLNSETTKFDHLAFQKRLRHYFTDTSPIAVDVEYGLDNVIISTKNGKVVELELDPKLDIRDNIRKVVVACEKELYPIAYQVKWIDKPLSKESKTSLYLKGLSVEAVENMEKVKVAKTYRVIRVGYRAMSLILRDKEDTLYKVIFKKPMLLVLNDIKNLNPTKLWEYIERNSVITQVIKQKDNNSE